MNVRRDHVAGGAFVVAGALILAVSGDYPFGTLASPGAGLLPTLLIVLLMASGLVIFLRARESPVLTEIDWSDVGHAAVVVAVTAAAIAAYTRAGFLITIPVMLFAFVYAVERRSLAWAVGFSAGVTVLAYILFMLLLKTPLPRGLLGF